MLPPYPHQSQQGPSYTPVAPQIQQIQSYVSGSGTANHQELYQSLRPRLFRGQIYMSGTQNLGSKELRDILSLNLGAFNSLMVSQPLVLP